MIKKSDILALLEGLPEEFEDERFMSGYNQLCDAFEPNTAQVAALAEGEASIKERGTIPFSELSEEVDAWLSSKSK